MKTRTSAARARFDKKAAERAEAFFARYCQQVKGEWAGRPLDLAPWQSKRIIRPLFGTLRKADNLRQFRTVFVEIPVGNGKSTLCSGLALELLFYDDEPGAEVYSAAADKDQARIVFEIAKRMVEAEPALSKRAQIFKDAIVVPGTGSTYKVLSAEAYSKHGLDAHGVIFDELHAQPNRELWDVLVARTRSRRQPVIAAITTAGYDRNSICYEVYSYAKKVEQGILDDPTFLPVIFEADDKDDWKSPKTWRKANPNLGVSVKPDYFENQFKKAVEIPAYENTFRRFHLNQWTEQATRWLPMDKWDIGASAPFALDDLAGRECFGGLDLASTTDLASLCLDFPDAASGRHRAVWWHWVPRDGALRREDRDRVPYLTWGRQGFIELTEGNVIDYEFIRKRINALADQVKIKEIAYDRWNASQIVTQLDGDGFTMVPTGMGFASMAAPSKELEKLVMGEMLEHAGNPVARWCASNVAVEMDAAENIKPSRKRSTEKIDAVVSLILALSRAMLQREKAGSVYDTRGILTLG